MTGKQCVKLFYLILCFSTTALAANGHFYVGGIIGDSFAIIGGSNPAIVYTSGTTITDSYPPFHRNNSTTLLNLNSGYEWSGEAWRPAMALGLGLYRTLNNFDISGQVIESAPGNTNYLYNYKYEIDQWVAMAQIKFTWLYHQFKPYLNAGIGSSWNRQSNYQESPFYSDGFVVYPPFQAYTSVNLAYELGVGVGYDFNLNGNTSELMHDRIALGYQYMNFGNIRFGERNADYPYALQPGRLRSNNVYISLTHFF